MGFFSNPLKRVRKDLGRVARLPGANPLRPNLPGVPNPMRPPGLPGAGGNSGIMPPGNRRATLGEAFKGGGIFNRMRSKY